MPYYEFFWIPETEEHLTEHDVTRDEFEHVVCNPVKTDHSRSTGDPACWGYAPDGRWLFCVYRFLDAVTVEPVTAYEPED